MDNFTKKNPFSFSNDLLKKINSNWFLIIAGNKEKYNMMTASWGTFGILWNKPVAQIFVRPSRYTHEFIIKNDFFSICFFDSSYNKILSELGSKSGRNFDKMNISGLKAKVYENKTIFFEEAKEVLILEKIYNSILDEKNISTDVKKDFYPQKDFHSFFIGQIIDYFIKNQ